MTAVYWTAGVVAYLVTVVIAARLIYLTERREYPNIDSDPACLFFSLEPNRLGTP